MIRHILVLAALLILADWVTADYLLIKVDFDQIDFAKWALSEEEFSDIIKGGGKVNTNSVNWLQGVFEFDPMELKEIKAIIETREKQDKEKKNDPSKKDPPIKKKDKEPNPPKKDKDAKPPQPTVLGYELRQKSSTKIFPNIPGVVDMKVLPKKTLSEEYQRRRTAATADYLLVNLALWSLQHGLTKEFHETMEELRLNNTQKPHPVYARYAQIKEDIKKKDLVQPRLPEKIMGDLKSLANKESAEKHYVIYWNKDLASEAQMDRRLARLENSYHNFFYWCALQEKMKMPVPPKHRLIVLVDAIPDEFNKRLEQTDLGKEAVSGFTLRRDKVLVLSNSPNVPLFHKLRSNLDLVRQARRLNKPQELYDGSIWKREDSFDPKGKYPRLDVAKIQMLAVLQKVFEDDVEIKTISREATRQLLLATGLVAWNVAMPAWLETGLVNYFEIPPTHLHLSFGLPRDDLRKQFLSLPPTGASFSQATILSDLATDKYFRGDPKKDPRSKDIKSGDKKLSKTDAKAQGLSEAVSWSLVYYLAEQKMSPNLAAYAETMSGLPRHMKFHPDTLQSYFMSAFNVNDSRLDAKKWFVDMKLMKDDNLEVQSFFAVDNQTKKKLP